MKKILGIVMVIMLCMSVVGCTDNTDAKMDYTKPVVVESIND